MIIVNFAHPLTASQRADIERIIARAIERIISATTHFDNAQLFAPQARAAVGAIELSNAEWQTLPLLVVLPSLSAIAALVLAEIHGRTGYFPAIVRLRPAQDSTPPQFEVAEIINLNQVREAARNERQA